MKRTSLVLDEHLLALARQVLGAKTYSAAVNTALEEVIRRRKIQGIPRFFGSGIWEGDLSRMREDQPRRGRRKLPAGPAEGDPNPILRGLSDRGHRD